MSTHNLVIRTNLRGQRAGAASHTGGMEPSDSEFFLVALWEEVAAGSPLDRWYHQVTALAESWENQKPWEDWARLSRHLTTWGSLSPVMQHCVPGSLCRHLKSF